MNISDIKKLAIYPAIGIARVGNSPEYFLASDIPGKVTVPTGGYKDDDDFFKKQAPRFRIYAMDAENNVLGEVTADIAEIEWRVHIANRKPGWYQFNNALDLGDKAIPSTFRNGGVKGDARDRLVIDPGVRRISGRSQSGPDYKFDTGKFFGKPVYLGELQTDDKGRLIVLGGNGKSVSKDGLPAITFANNDGWHDDVSDGPVRATVVINGEKIEAEPAMVACVPPNFGPGLFSVVTMYDVVYDLYIREGWLKGPQKITFWEHIYPILQRMTNAQWVNDGFFMLFGTNSPSDFTDPAVIQKLSDPAETNKEDRLYVFKWFRDTFSSKYQPDLIPPYYGDLFDDYKSLPHVDLSVTATQYDWLKRWAAGEFSTGVPATDIAFDDMNPMEQTAALLKAPLEECLGGPFHPGIEITWPFRNIIMWDQPFRLKILPEEKTVSDNYGPILTSVIALATGGPLDGSGPGSLTRWLGVPWQTDEASCLSGYDPTLYLPLPSFWAARVPNFVLSKDSYERTQATTINTGQKLKHFSYRVDWLRDFSTSYVGRINDMVAKWHQLGVIAKHETAAGSDNSFLPTEWWVETDRLDKGKDPSFQQVKRAEHEPEPEMIPLLKSASLQAASASTDEEERTTRPFRRHEM